MPHDTESRFVYAIRSTRDKAESFLEDCYASGDIVAGEAPKIERRTTATGRTVYCVTLLA